MLESHGCQEAMGLKPAQSSRHGIKQLKLALVWNLWAKTRCFDSAVGKKDIHRAKEVANCY